MAQVNTCVGLKLLDRARNLPTRRLRHLAVLVSVVDRASVHPIGDLQDDEHRQIELTEADCHVH